MAVLPNGLEVSVAAVFVEFGEVMRFRGEARAKGLR